MTHPSIFKLSLALAIAAFGGTALTPNSATAQYSDLEDQFDDYDRYDGDAYWDDYAAPSEADAFDGDYGFDYDGLYGDDSTYGYDDFGYGPYGYDTYDYDYDGYSYGYDDYDYPAANLSALDDYDDGWDPDDGPGDYGWDGYGLDDDDYTYWYGRPQWMDADAHYPYYDESQWTDDAWFDGTDYEYDPFDNDVYIDDYDAGLYD